MTGSTTDGLRGIPRRSALADPAEPRFRRRLPLRRLMLAVAPAATGTVLMALLPARNADHDRILPGRRVFCRPLSPAPVASVEGQAWVGADERIMRELSGLSRWPRTSYRPRARCSPTGGWPDASWPSASARSWPARITRWATPPAASPSA